MSKSSLLPFSYDNDSSVVLSCAHVSNCELVFLCDCVFTDVCVSRHRRLERDASHLVSEIIRLLLSGSRGGIEAIMVYRDHHSL